MRYHTAPLIGFTAYLEDLRRENGSDSDLFESGNQFQCFVRNMKIRKSSVIENKTVYRNYSLYFTYGGYGGNSYTFRLDPEVSIFKHQVEGLAAIQGSNRYEIKRSSFYKESHVNFTVGSPNPSIYGSYYNWHSERGEFNGKLSNDTVTLNVTGTHYRRDKSSPYYKLSPSQRNTTWNFEIPLTQIKLPRV